MTDDGGDDDRADGFLKYFSFSFKLLNDYITNKLFYAQPN